ncbi:ComF family protein [Lutibacter citreus]|uniref:ComF family protein n=1 Tax=Lutibacter citreus TaxID=2138210 RepID=UPI000DBE30D7|nr:ComF family protein [Lutibacter citreus]
MKILSDLLYLFYPEICLCCKNQLTTNEKYVCIECRHDLPVTNFTNENNNLIEKIFYGREEVIDGTSLFYFLKKGKIQHLIHELKYNKQQQVGEFIGNWLADEIIESDRFKSIDCIIPVPLHKKKFRSRGYNQVTTFGKCLSLKLNIPFYENILIKTSATKTQTKKNRFSRWKNAEHLFTLKNAELLEAKHILLIDDIITTGATLESCAKTLKGAKNIKLSIATMAYTK